MWAMFHFCKRREYRHRIVCPECGTVMYPCGLHCPKCGAPNPFPRALNWLGYSRLRKVVPESGRIRHEEALRSFRRCFYCGEPLKEPTLLQKCPACGKAVLQGERSVDIYDTYISRRTWWTFGAVVFLGIIPILGPLLASSLYKRTLIDPYSLYMTVFRESFLDGIPLSVPPPVPAAALHRHHRDADSLPDGIPCVPQDVSLEDGKVRIRGKLDRPRQRLGISCLSAVREDVVVNGCAGD